jgi:hypothetical protein
MVKTDDKRTYYNTVRKQGSSLVVSIPPKVVKHLNLDEGDEIGFQKEHSQEIEEARETGDYGSFWNETNQSGEKQGLE